MQSECKPNATLLCSVLYCQILSRQMIKFLMHFFLHVLNKTVQDFS